MGMNEDVSVKDGKLRVDDRLALLPAGIWHSLAFRVYPRAAFPDVGGPPYDWVGFTVARSAAVLTDEELVAKVRNDPTVVQGEQVCRDDGTLCDHVGVFRDGAEYVVASDPGFAAGCVKSVLRPRPKRPTWRGMAKGRPHGLPCSLHG